MSDALLIFGSTQGSATLRHEIPLAIVDPFLWVQADDRATAVLNVLERDRVLEAVPGLEALSPEALGIDELMASGLRWPEIDIELSVRAVDRLGVGDATVPGDFPLALADRLRAEGVRVEPDQALFDRRRRVKNEAELAGIRRAQLAADAGMAAAAELLRGAGDGTLTAETVRGAIREACASRGAPAPPDIIVAPGAQAAGHEAGSGPLPAGVPIVIDLWPQDEASGCWADMTRTFVIGEPPAEVVEQHRLTLDALRRTTAATRPGVPGSDLHDIACDVYEAAGHPTQRTKEEGQELRDGFNHSLGHGVGLEVHEEPALGRSGRDPLLAGDVVTLEPGTYRQDSGGVRLEDLALVTDEGCEILTDFPYELAP